MMMMMSPPPAPETANASAQTLAPNKRPVLGQTREPQAWQEAANFPRLERNLTPLRNLQQFVSQPVRWNFEDEATLAAGELPITRPHWQPFWTEHETSRRLWLSLAASWLVLGLLLVLLVQSLTPFWQGETNTPEAQGQSLVAVEAEANLDQSPERLQNRETTSFALLGQALEENPRVAFRDLPKRDDPFRPLVDVPWWQRILDANREPALEDAETQRRNAGDFSTPRTNSPFGPAPQDNPSMQAPALPLSFVGLIADEANPQNATVLIRARYEDQSRLVSKRVGESVTLFGKTLRLKALKGKRLAVEIDGLTQWLSLVESPGAELRSATAASPAPDNIEEILNELENLQ